MGQNDYDLVVIGGGPAGEKAAAQVAYFGLDDKGQPTVPGYKTALVEKEAELGGACINTGTLASKTLRETSLFLSGSKSRQLYGIDTRIKKDITLPDFMYRKLYVQEQERKRAKQNLERHHIARYFGSGSIGEDGKSVIVRNNKGEETRIGARVILIATGSKPTRPKDIPFNPDSVFDSDTVLEMRDLPKSMIVFGGGVIGSEYASLFAQLGIKVSLVHRNARVLEFLDLEVADVFMEAMRKAGIDLLMGDELASITREGKWVKTKLKSGKEVVTEAALYAIGRNGNTVGLGLEKVGVTPNKRGQVTVDPITFQVKAGEDGKGPAAPNVYAAGDVIGPPSLASTSMEQGRMAMCHAFGLSYRKSKALPILPAGIYTIPEISCVGETEESCKKAGTPYVAGRSRFGAHARGQIIGDTDGMIKLIFSAPGGQDKWGGKLLGCHVIGEMASELVHVGMGCLHFEGEIDYFIESVFNYPTLGDAYKYAAFDALGQLNKLRNPLKGIAEKPAEKAQPQGVA